MTAQRPPREVLFEIQYLGAFARVAAVDSETGVEVVVQGPATAARADLEALALRKLARALGDAEQPSEPSSRPGRLV